MPSTKFTSYNISPKFVCIGWHVLLILGIHVYWSVCSLYLVLEKERGFYCYIGSRYISWASHEKVYCSFITISFPHSSLYIKSSFISLCFVLEKGRGFYCYIGSRFIKWASHEKVVVASLLYHSSILYFTRGSVAYITIDLLPIMKKLEAGCDKIVMHSSSTILSNAFHTPFFQNTDALQELFALL